MTEDQTPYISPNEPTEAAVLRAILARLDASNDGFTPHTEADRAALRRMVTEASALRFALRKLGWLYEPQSILDAG